MPDGPTGMPTTGLGAGSIVDGGTLVGVAGVGGPAGGMGFEG